MRHAYVVGHKPKMQGWTHCAQGSEAVLELVAV